MSGHHAHHPHSHHPRSITLTPALRAEYEQLFASCELSSQHRNEVRRLVHQISHHRGRYDSVGRALGVPWWAIALIHAMEGGLRFTTHLHNGDPLTARTVHVPRGRPREGNPPFTWEASAIDALRSHGFDCWHDWSIPGVLFKLEGYNGWGVRLYHPESRTAYLWSYTNHYTRGKYVRDGHWDANAVSRQPGAAAIMIGMIDSGQVSTGLLVCQ